MGCETVGVLKQRSAGGDAMAEWSEHLVSSSLLIEGSAVRIPAKTQFLLQGFSDGGTTRSQLQPPIDMISISSSSSGISISSAWHPSSMKFQEKMEQVNRWLEREVLPWWLDEQDGADAD